jgi:hypothetical protein
VIADERSDPPDEEGRSTNELQPGVGVMVSGSVSGARRDTVTSMTPSSILALSFDGCDLGDSRDGPARAGNSARWVSGRNHAN